MTEERFNELENRLIEIIQSEQHRGKLLFLKNGGILRDLWGNTKGLIFVS